MITKDRLYLVVKGMLDTLLRLGVIDEDRYIDVLLGLDRRWREQDMASHRLSMVVI